MNTKEQKEQMTDCELIGRPYGICDGARIYRVRRGVFQVQNPTRPGQSSFDGTKREVERAMKHSIIKTH